MPLVDYAASDDEISDSEEEQQHKASVKLQAPPPLPQTNNNNPIPESTSSFQKLPDASMLFDSPRIAAAMAESSWRKRELNALFSSSSLPPKRENVPETGGGSLIPPQLNGRSNVVTEEISKLFVKRNAAEP